MSKCNDTKCVWTKKGYCKKRGKMTCRGKDSKECSEVKIHIPTLVPSVRGRCKYTRGKQRNFCRRITRYSRRVR